MCIRDRPASPFLSVMTAQAPPVASRPQCWAIASAPLTESLKQTSNIFIPAFPCLFSLGYFAFSIAQPWPARNPAAGTKRRTFVILDSNVTLYSKFVIDLSIGTAYNRTIEAATTHGGNKAMIRLSIETPDRAQQVVQDLCRDMGHRIAANPPGLCPCLLYTSRCV